MAWQKFQNTNQRFEERISISPNNSFGFPKMFYEKNKLELFKYLVIFYNPEEKAIGFQFTSSEDEKHKFRITRSKGQFGINVTAKSFFKTYDLDANSLKGKYFPEKKNVEGIGEMFVINLNKNQDIETNVDQKANEIPVHSDTPVQTVFTPPVIHTVEAQNSPAQPTTLK